MAAIALENIVKRFGTFEVIKSIDLKIREGEFVVLVGPSGCGKSTLLRMIAGLESVTTGEVKIGGKVVNNLRPRERDVAMVFQSYALYPHMTVWDNMAYTLKLARLPKAEIEQRIKQAANTLGLIDLLDRYPKHLSGGQRQRVAMGRAIVRDPKVFLFDEPLSNLDAKLRVQMRTEIKALHQRLGSTTVYVTHDQVEAMTMADRIAIMHQGEVQQVGEPLELYDKPGNLFVAGFIGSPAMNLIPGVIEDDRFLADSGLVLPLAPKTKRAGGRAVYGIRPEHFDINPEGIDTLVEVVEPTGSETQLRLRASDILLSYVTNERVRVRPGERIKARPRSDQVHLFDERTGKRTD